MICRREKEGRSEEEGKNEERQIQMILEAHFLEVVFPFAKSRWRFPVKGPCPRNPSMGAFRQAMSKASTFLCRIIKAAYVVFP